MYQKVITVLSLAITLLAFSNAEADIHYEKKFPVKICQKEANLELKAMAMQALKSATKKTKCGHYEAAKQELYSALEILEELQARNVRGYCYSKLNCRNPKVSGQMVTQAQCKATGIASSWKPMLPAPGACVSPL